MDSLRPIEAAEKATETVKSKARGKLLDWLPSPHECDNCGALCEAKHEYVERQAMYMDVWRCPECDSRYYRDDENPLRAEMWDK